MTLKNFFQKSSSFPSLIIAGVFILALSACSTTTPVPTQVCQATSLPCPTQGVCPAQQPTIIVVTATPMATEVVAPTEKPEETQEIEAKASPEGGITPLASPAAKESGTDNVKFYCQNKDTGIPVEPKFDSLEPPADSNVGTFVKDMYEVMIPGTLCGFIYQFDAPVTPGTEVQIINLQESKPWLKLEMKTSETNPSLGYASTVNDYIRNPGFWSILYRVAVVDKDGTVIREDKVNYFRKRPWPELCWNGVLPDPFSYICPPEG